MAGKLQTKIMLILMAVFLLTLGLNGLFTSRIFRAEYSAAVENEAFAVGQGLKVQVERLLAIGLPLGDLVGFEEICDEVVKKYPNISYAAVVDTGGTFLFHSDRSEQAKRLEAAELLRAVRGEQASAVSYPAGGRDIYGFVVPVANGDGRHVGAIVLGYPAETITRKVATLTGQNVFVSFLQFGVALALIALTLSLWVTKPLVKLQHATEEIVARGTGSFRPVDIHSQDEIGQLAASFNMMATELQKTTVSKASLEEALQQLKAIQAQLIQQEKLAGIGQLAAGVAHEINNPMAVIISNLEMLRQYVDRIKQFQALQEKALVGLVDGAARTATVVATLGEARQAMKIDHVLGDTEGLIKETLEGAARVKNIVQNLQGFARSDQMRKLANINDCIETTVNMIINEIKYRAVITTDLGPIPLTMCNPGQLNQVFMNIIVNAAQANETFGEVRITTWADQDNIFVAIADTGRGIPATIMNRIFEPFFTTREVGKGTGLGLSVSYDIVRNHGGEIRVASEVGKGTTFTIVIPIVRTDNRWG